jgi:CHAT domain-containing protein/Tfp pilus assembly protein PilF
MFSQADIWWRNASRSFVASCALGILLLCGVEPGIYAQSQNKTAILSPEKKAAQLRTTALELVKRATIQDLTVAAAQLRQSANLFRSARLNSAAARSYLSLGEIYFTWSRYHDAEGMYRLALSLSSQTDPALKCFILSHMAIAYATVGSIDASLSFAKQAKEFADRTVNPEAKAEAAEALGLAFFYSQDPHQALDLFQTAEEIFKNDGNIEAQAAASRYMGWALASLGLTRAALNAQDEGLRFWTSTRNIYGVAQAHAALGLLLAFAGETEKALADYQYARDIFRRVGDRDNEAVVLNGFGLLARELGNYEDSLRYFTQARAIFAVVGDKFGEIGAIDGAALAQWSLHRYKRAESLYRLELQRTEEIESYREHVSALSNLGEIYDRQHNYGRAKVFFSQALAICRSIDHAIGEADVLIHLGHLYLEEEEYKSAVESFQQALQSAEKVDRVSRQAEAHYELATVYYALKQYDQAEAESESAIQIIESERTKVPDFDSRASYFASVHEYYQLYIDILMQLDQQHPGQGFGQLAFEAAEKSKVRSLLDMLANSSEGTQCHTGALDATADIGNSTSQTGDCSIPAASALTLAQVQIEIQGDDVALLEYALSPQTSYLWLVADGRIASYRLPDERQINELAVRYRAALTAWQPISGENAGQQAARVARADHELDRLSSELSGILLGPVAGSLAGKRVIIVPDGLLRYVPFSALQLPSVAGDKTDTRGKKFFEVVTLPSASTLASLRAASAKRTAPTKLAAVFADPVFTADDPRVQKHGRSKAQPAQIPILSAALRDVSVNASRIPRLIASRDEATAIANALSGNADVVTDFAANREAVLSSDLSQYRYIHFATHGLLDTRHPELSGLVLSLVDQDGKPEDGYLRVRDIYGLKLNADLVVLSSCSSALGKDVESEGIIGLTRAFLFAGSKRVISSLWKVDDQATAELMKNFYSQLHAGASPAEALRSAQSTLANDPHWNSPYYWGAFILQGEYR